MIRNRINPVPELQNYDVPPMQELAARRIAQSTETWECPKSPVPSPKSQFFEEIIEIDHKIPNEEWMKSNPWGIGSQIPVRQSMKYL